MRVYVIRHGHAIPHRGPVHDDARWLLAEGRHALGQVGGVLRGAGVELDAVLSSPLVRAVQTAELLAAALGYDRAVEALPALSPDGSPGSVAEQLPSRGSSIAAIGHEPTISALAGHLAGRRIGSFRPGQVVCVEDGEAKWVLNPDSLAIHRFG
jgi:phosphohistidine phosphatase